MKKISDLTEKQKKLLYDANKKLADALLELQEHRKQDVKDDEYYKKHSMLQRKASECLLNLIRTIKLLFSEDIEEDITLHNLGYMLTSVIAEIIDYGEIKGHWLEILENK